MLVGLGAGRRLDLDQVQDLETVGAQQPDPLAVREMVLDAAVRPLEAVHPELGTLQRLDRKDVLLGRAEDRQGRVAEEDELAARAQQACSARAPVYSAFARVEASMVGSATGPERDLALRRLWRAGLAPEVVGHRRGELPPDRGKRTIGRTRCTLWRRQRHDRPCALDDEHPGRARGDDPAELTAERLLAVA